VAPSTRTSHTAGPLRGTSAARVTLLSSVLDTVQDHVSSTGIVGVTEGVLGVLGFAGLISSLFGEAAIKAGAIVATMLAILGLFVLLTVSRIQLKSRNEVVEKLVKHYHFALETRYQHAWRTKSWHQIISIDRHGNTTEEIICTIVADSEFVDFFSIWSGTDWDWPAHYQKKVRYHATTAMNGAEGGVRLTGTHTWYDRDRLSIIVHLSQPIPKGTEATFNLLITWPLKCAPLIQRGAPEEFARTFPAPLESLHYTVELPRGYQARFDTFGLRNGTTKYDINSSTTEQGGTTISLTAEDVLANQRVGMRIDPI
jgi:hypothetical protein